jgi:hypothetical protein
LGHQRNQRPGNLLLVFSFWPTLSRASYYERLEKLAIERICSQAGADAGKNLNCCVPLEYESFEVPSNRNAANGCWV